MTRPRMSAPLAAPAVVLVAAVLAVATRPEVLGSIEPPAPSRAPGGEGTPRAAPSPSSTTTPSTTTPSTSVSLLEPRGEALEPGDRGPAVRALQARLVELGYWLGGVDGSFGSLTRQAVSAFQGVERLPRSGLATPDVRRALMAADRPEPLGGPGDRIEISLDQQVLRVVRGGAVVWAVHTSTGRGGTYHHPDGGTRSAETPRGEWRVAWRVDGWRHASLGRLYRPAYFHADGIAVHGHPDVPLEPASHGCARVAMEVMDLLWEEGFVDEGARVLVR